MGINKKYINTFIDAYENLEYLNPAISFSYNNETWIEISSRYIPNVKDGAYLISDHGNVYSRLHSPSNPNGGIIHPSKSKNGYLRIPLKLENGKRSSYSISRLMMLHFNFIPGCEFMEVDHIDGNKERNVLDNLEWVTPQENTHRAIKNGLRTLSYTTDNGTLLYDNDAHNLYNFAISGISYEDLSKQYSVSIEYIKGLVEGYIRPYIANKYYDRIHV